MGRRGFAQPEQEGRRCPAVRVTDHDQLVRLAALWKSKLDRDFEVGDGGFGDPDDRQGLVFGVRSTKVLTFGKGEPFSREAVEWLRDFLVACDEYEGGGARVDEIATRQRAKSGAPPQDLGADLIIQRITDFLELWLPARIRPTPEQRHSAGLVIRLLAGWFLARRLITEPVYMEVDHYTQHYSPTPPARRRPRYRSPGSVRPRWR